MTHLHWPLLLVAALAVPSSTPPAEPNEGRQAPARTRDVYASVIDSGGNPVQGLSAADFSVREDGVAREVLKAGPATVPLTLSIVIDDSQAAESAIQDLREGLTAFVKRLEGKAEIALATVGERPASLVEYTTSTEQLTQAINRMFARPGSGAYLMDGLVEVSRGLARREADRKVIVALSIDAGVEFSNRYYEPVLEELQKSGATLYVLAIGSPGSSLDDEMRNRNMVIAEGTERSGGRREQLLTSRAIPERLRQLAEVLLNQYVVTYSRPETLIPPRKLEVSVSRPDTRVYAPRWTGQ